MNTRASVNFTIWAYAMLALSSALCTSACPQSPSLPALLDAGSILDDGSSEDRGFVYDASVGDLGPMDAGDPIVVEQVIPNNGVRSGGYRVRISGEGFTTDTQVWFGDNLGDNLLLQNSRSITVRVPANALSGPVDLRLDNGASQDILVNGFTYFDDLSIASLSPQLISSQGGALIDVQGLGFSGELLVLCGGRQVADLSIIDDSQLRFIAPPGLPGRVDLQIFSTYGQASLPLAIEYRDALRIDQANPQAVPLSGGETVTLSGAGFRPDTQVFLDANAVNFEYMDSTHLRFVAPAQSSPGAYALRLVDDLSQAELLPGLIYLASPQAAPRITALQPACGDPAGDELIDIFGAGLDAMGLQVWFDGRLAPIVSAASSQQLTVRSPAHANGEVRVQITSALGNAELDPGFCYQSALRVDALSPNQGPSSGGELLSISAAGFVSGTQAWLGGQALSDLQFVDANTLTATSPPGSAGPVDLVLRDPSGRKQQLDAAYVYVDDLRLVGLRPVRGGMAGGTYVKVYGSGFLNGAAPQLLFGQDPGQDLQVHSDNMITLRSPAHAPALLDVTLRQGDSQASVPRAYTYYDPGFLFGGARGGSVDGALYVSCYNSMTRLGVPGLSVQVGLETGAYFALTDANGQATLSGPDLYGPQTLSVAGAGYESITLVQVDASEVSLFVNPTSFSAASGSAPPLPPPPSISGQLYGFAKELFDPAALGPGESALAIVQTTVRTVFNSPMAPVQSQYVAANGDRYTIPMARPGRLAVVAVAGIYDSNSGSFRPRQIGFHRGVSAAYGDVLDNIDIELTVPLNSSLDITLPSIPLGDPDPESGVVMPFINFGGEGVYALADLRVPGASTVTLKDFPDLPGEMLSFLAGAFVLDTTRPCQLNHSCPLSVVMRDGVGDLRSGLTLDPLLGFAELIEPEENGVMLGGVMRWKPAPGTTPSYYEIYLAGLDGTAWDFYLPGQLNKLIIPRFAELSTELPPHNAGLGAYQVQMVSVYSPGFDFNNFSYLDLSSQARRSWSQQTFKFVKADDSP